MEQQDLLSNDLVINDISQANLFSAARWGKFLAIMGYIFSGLMLLGGIAVQVNSSSLSYYSRYSEYIGIVYIILGVILFFPCLFLHRFSGNMHEAIRSTSQESVDKAFVNLKAMFKFYGIMTIIILGFYLVIFIAYGIGSMAPQ